MTDSSTATQHTWDTTENISAYFVLFSALLAVVMVLSKYLHDRPRLNSYLPEAGMILIVGMIAGSIFQCFIDFDAIRAREAAPEYDDAMMAQSDNDSVAQSLLSFSPKVFFIALLPPIIFNSGYHLRREMFFRHLFPIVLFAIVGTLVSALSIALIMYGAVAAGLTGGFVPTIAELLTFGALISATDPVSTLAVFQAKRVDPHLFYLVFGESVLNDAVGLVLFKAFATFVVPENDAEKVLVSFGEFFFSFSLDAIGSPLLGLVCGGATALLFKHVDMRKHQLLELTLYVLIMYVPFLMAELLHRSGIVTILFTGMTARSFVIPNLSEQTADHAEALFRVAAHLAETSIFLELGLSVFGLRGSFNAQFIAWALFACLLGRVFNVYPITFFYNRTLKRKEGQTLEENDGVMLENKPSPPPPVAYVKTVSTKRGGVRVGSQASMMDALAMSDHHYRIQEEKLFKQASHQSYFINSGSQDDGIQHKDTDFSSVTPVQQRDLKISGKTAHMLWFAGLRGAVAYACVRSFPNTFGHRTEFVMTTMAIVLVTVFMLGGTTEVALNCLKIDMKVDEEEYMDEWHRQRQQNTVILQLEEKLNEYVVRQDEEEETIPGEYEDGSEIHEMKSGIKNRHSDDPHHHRGDGFERSDLRNIGAANSFQEIGTPHSQLQKKSGMKRSPSSGYLQALRRKGESLFDFGGETCS